MKKLMMISAALMLAATTFAGDVCAIRLSVKEPVIKQGKSYYKDFKTNTYKGWINFEYEEDGTMPATCAAVIYGNFNGVREAREYDVGIATCNSYGKNGDKIEISMLLEDESSV